MVRYSLFQISLLVLCCSCTASRELAGVMTGTALGAGIGAIAGASTNEIAKGVAIGAGSGALVGLVGARLASQREEDNQLDEKEIVLRKAYYPSDEQKQIDAVRSRMNDDSILGGGETCPWNERYIGDEPYLPYQGPTAGQFN